MNQNQQWLQNLLFKAQEMMGKYNRFMVGRNGMDDLSRFLIVLWMVFTFVGVFFRYPAVDMIKLILLLIAAFRILSRNIAARWKENQVYQHYAFYVTEWYRNLKFRVDQKKQEKNRKQAGGNGQSSSASGASSSSTGNNRRNSNAGNQSGTGSSGTAGAGSTTDSQYCIFVCPSCGQKIRIPKGHGKIMIHCRKCGKEFEGTT